MQFDWSSLLGLIPTIINSLKITTAPVAQTTAPQTTVPPRAPDGFTPQGNAAVPPALPLTGPDPGIKALQKLINTYAPPSLLLREDGWLGPKTEAAILGAIKQLSPLLASYFGK